MPLNRNQVMSALYTLSDSKNLEVTVIESGKGACIAALFAFGGGIIGGPVGLAIGGTVGSCLAAYNGKGKFKSLVEILLEMPEDKRIALADSVLNIIRGIDATDVAMLTTLLLTNNSLQSLVLKEVAKFLKSEMGLQLSL